MQAEQAAERAAAARDQALAERAAAREDVARLTGRIEALEALLTRPVSQAPDQAAAPVQNEPPPPKRTRGRKPVLQEEQPGLLP
jgi:hypothetical protein